MPILGQEPSGRWLEPPPMMSPHAEKMVGSNDVATKSRALQLLRGRNCGLRRRRRRTIGHAMGGDLGAEIPSDIAPRATAGRSGLVPAAILIC
jgi:hypothetical protein